MAIKMTLTEANKYGRLSIEGVADYWKTWRVRNVKQKAERFYHRAKNGVYDPFSYFHILDVLMQVEPGQDFRTTELIPVLVQEKPQLIWDATTVGRVLTDMAETLHEGYGRPIIGYTRRWNGMTYDMPSHPENRAALHRLHEDLIRLCDHLLHDEMAGKAPKRMDSPLLFCASVMDEAKSA